MSRIKKMEEFIENFTKPEQLQSLMLDRLDIETLYVINNYSELIAKVKDKTPLQDKDVLSCAIIIGYLLKGFSDRLDLEERMSK